MIGLWIKAGFDHIVAADALDHQLFLVVLCARGLRLEPRALLLRVTGFTLGHSVTLVVASAGWIDADPRWVEALIPATIPAAAAAAWRASDGTPTRPAHEIVVPAAFGLLHGLGFAGTMGASLDEVGGRIPAVLGFNLGVELGQILVVGLLAAAFSATAWLPGGRTRWTKGALVVAGFVGAALAVDRVF